MNTREFREAIAEAWLRGVEFAMTMSPPSEHEQRRQDTAPGTGDGALNILKRHANRYATQQVIVNSDKLEPM